MPQTIEDPELKQDKTYHKSIDALIEDAEIEAEVEAEQHIRSKNTRLITISLVGIALIGFIYWQVSETTVQKETAEVALPELTEAQPAEKVSTAKSEPAPPETKETEAPSTAEIAKVEPDPAPPVSEKPTPSPAESPKIEPEVAKISPVVPPPVEKKAEPVIKKALPKEPAPQQSITKPVVSQPVKTKAPDATPAVKKHFVQLGSFSVEDNAKGLVKRVKNKGFKPSILVKSGQATKHVVFVGGFSTKEDGGQALSDLESKGFKSVMEKLADNSYTIVLGKFTTSRQAEALRDKLSLAGFLSSARAKKASSIIYIVQLGGFDGLRQAKLAQKKVGRAGFNDSFIR
jgi:cell division protein FtsN